MVTGKLPVRVVVNTGRLPLTPREKRVGTQGKGWCHYHFWEIMVTCCITTCNVAEMFVCPYQWGETVYLKVTNVLWFPVKSSSWEIMVTFCRYNYVANIYKNIKHLPVKSSSLSAYSNGPPSWFQTSNHRGDGVTGWIAPSLRFNSY